MAYFSVWSQHSPLMPWQDAGSHSTSSAWWSFGEGLTRFLGNSNSSSDESFCWRTKMNCTSVISIEWSMSDMCMWSSTHVASWKLLLCRIWVNPALLVGGKAAAAAAQSSEVPADGGLSGAGLFQRLWHALMFAYIWSIITSRIKMNLLVQQSAELWQPVSSFSKYSSAYDEVTDA